MPTRYLEVVQPKSKIAIWAWSPIIVLRVSLFIVYFLYVYGAFIAFLAGVPVFTLTTPEGYTSIWAVLLGISAILATIACTSDRWQKLEKWSSLVLSSMMLAYIIALNLLGYFEGDLGRQFIGVIALIAGVLPIGRFVYLAAQSGKKKHVPTIISIGG